MNKSIVHLYCLFSMFIESGTFQLIKGQVLRIDTLHQIQRPDTLHQIQRPDTLHQVQRSDTLHQVQLPEVTITALLTPLKISSVPYGVSIQKGRSNTPGLSLLENISGLPGGLEVDAQYNFAVGDKITNRGFGARTQFGVRGVRIVNDGVPVTFVDGQSNLEMIDLQDISYVELLRGPGSSIYGNASGGVLFLHSYPINPDIVFSSVSSTVGSNGLIQLNGSVGGRFGNSNIAGNLTNFQYTGFRDHASAFYDRGILKLNSELSLADDLQIQAGYVHFSARDPGSLTLQESIQNPELADPLCVTNAAGQSGFQGQVSAVWNHMEKDFSFFKLTLYDITRSVDNPIIGKIVVLPQNSGGTNFIYSFKSRIGGLLIPWTVGAEFAFRLNHRKNYINNDGDKGMIILNQDEQIVGTGIFMQTLVPVSKDLDVHGSLRLDLTYFGIVNRLVDTLAARNTGSRTMNGLSPSVGLVYRKVPNMNCFIDFSTSFETPTSTELANRPDQVGGFNPNLNPSHAIEFEAGIRGKMYSIINYDLTGYLIQTRDEIVPYQIPSSPGQYFYRNAASTARSGVEAAIGFQPLQFLTINLSTNFIYAFYSTYAIPGISYNGNEIPGINKIRGVMELRFHSQQGWYFSTLFQSFGTVYTDDSNSARTNPYLLTDFSLGHEDLRLGKKWIHTFRLSAGLSNAFAVRYITSVAINAADSKYYGPGPGRTFYANLCWVFGKS